MMLRHTGEVAIFVSASGDLLPMIITKHHGLREVDGIVFPLVNGSEEAGRAVVVGLVNGQYIVNVPYWNPDRDEFGYYKPSMMYPKSVWFPIREGVID